MRLIFSGSTISCREVQPSKALAPMLVSPVGSITRLSAEKP